MRKITERRIRKIVQLHELFLNFSDKGRRADFNDHYLQGADFESTNLTRSIFEAASLKSANFKKANLIEANFSYADLQYADFENADLRDANFQHANLQGAILKGANLSGANFAGARMPSKYFSFNQIGVLGEQFTYSFDEDKVWSGEFIGTLEEFYITRAGVEYSMIIDTIRFFKKLYGNRKLYEDTDI